MSRGRSSRHHQSESSRFPSELGHRRRRRLEKVSAPRVLQDTCNYIRTLQREVDGLSERLSQVLATMDGDSPEAAIIRSLLM